MLKPACLKDLHTFLDMVQVLSKFSLRTVELVDPLHDLTKKHAPYVCGPEHSQAFYDIKKVIVQAPILKYYNPMTFPYGLKVQYIKGSTSQLADCLSKCGCQKDKIPLPKLKVHAITKQLPVTVDRLNKFCTETALDEELSMLKYIVCKVDGLNTLMKSQKESSHSRPSEKN